LLLQSRQLTTAISAYSTSANSRISSFGAYCPCSSTDHISLCPLSSGQVGQHGLERLFGVFDTLLSAPDDQAVRAHQHRTTRAYTIGRWPAPINIYQVAASADRASDQFNTQSVCHLQSGVVPGGAVGTGQQHEVLAEQDAGAQAFALTLQKHVWGADAGPT